MNAPSSHEEGPVGASHVEALRAVLPHAGGQENRQTPTRSRDEARIAAEAVAYLSTTSAAVGCRWSSATTNAPSTASTLPSSPWKKRTAAISSSCRRPEGMGGVSSGRRGAACVWGERGVARHGVEADRPADETPPRPARRLARGLHPLRKRRWTIASVRWLRGRRDLRLRQRRQGGDDGGPASPRQAASVSSSAARTPTPALLRPSRHVEDCGDQRATTRSPSSPIASAASAAMPGRSLRQLGRDALSIEFLARSQAVAGGITRDRAAARYLLNLGLACHFVGFDTGFVVRPHPRRR